MSNPGIHIHRLIVHRVDPTASTDQVLSDLDSPTDDPDVLAFLRSHIHQNSTHTNVVKARFRPSGTKPDFPTACDKLFAELGEAFEHQSLLDDHDVVARAMFECGAAGRHQHGDCEGRVNAERDQPSQ